MRKPLFNLTKWQNDVLEKIIWGGHIAYYKGKEPFYKVHWDEEQKDISSHTFRALFSQGLVKKKNEDEETIIYR